MTAMTLAATRLADRREQVLDKLTALWVRATLDSPAVAMRAVAAVDGAPGELGAVRVEQDGKTLFRGTVDSQRLSVSGEGRLLELEARSAGGALLDNEALPCTLLNASMTTVFRLFAQPYGFVLANAAPGGGLGSYTVHKGCCEWDAVAGFCRRVYGHMPYIDGELLVVDRPHGAQGLVIGSGGVAYTRLEHAFQPYHLLSKVVMRDEDGRYSLAVRSADAAYCGVRRKRYVIPPDEFTDAPGMDANQRIRRGLLQKETVTAVLPGIVRAKPGDGARVQDEALAAGGWMIREVLWRQGRGGITTSLTLCKAAYWD